MFLRRTIHNPDIWRLIYEEEKLGETLSDLFDVFELIYCLKWQLLAEWQIWDRWGSDAGKHIGYSKIRIDLEKTREMYNIALDETRNYVLAQMPDYENSCVFVEAEVKIYTVVSYPFTLDLQNSRGELI